MHWFMARASAGKDANFSFNRRIRTNNIVGIEMDLNQVRMSQGDALELFHYHVFWLVNKLFHATSFLPKTYFTSFAANAGLFDY
jgi:hypothetical protein